MSHIMQAVTGGSSGHGRYAATVVKMWMCAAQVASECRAFRLRDACAQAQHHQKRVR